MKIFENKKGMAQTVDVAGVVTKVVDKPQTIESQLIRAVGVVAIALLVLAWLGTQLGITKEGLAEGLTAHNFFMWGTVGVILIFGSVLLRIGWDIALGRKASSAFKTAKLEMVTVVIAAIFFVIINAGWLARFGLTIMP